MRWLYRHRGSIYSCRRFFSYYRQAKLSSSHVLNNSRACTVRKAGAQADQLADGSDRKKSSTRWCGRSESFRESRARLHPILCLWQCTETSSHSLLAAAFLLISFSAPSSITHTYGNHSFLHLAQYRTTLDLFYLRLPTPLQVRLSCSIGL